jgi:hypothetical protein
MKRLRLTEKGEEILGFLIMSFVIVLGVIILNARFEYLNEKSVETEVTTQNAR